MRKGRRSIAIVLMAIMAGDIAAPTVAYALTSGPSQPEVQGFTPANANDLVDLFSGNFSYNIPLLDVEGYPVNLSYTAGIGMDQEASWVGLGWNLSPGVVERNLRGVPDDFMGDLIKRTQKQRPNRTFGIGFAPTFEAFGVKIPVLGEAAGQLGLSISPSFNSYEGVMVESGISMSMKSAHAHSNTFNGSLGLSSHSNRGLRMQPTFGFGKNVGENFKVGLNFGLTIDSRAGLTNASFGANLSETKETCHAKNSRGDRYRNDDVIATSFDIGASTYMPEIASSMRTSSISFNVTTGMAFWGLHPNVRWSAFYSSMNVRHEMTERRAYGYFHLGQGALNRQNQLDFNREKDGPYSPDKSALGIASLTNDIFTVSSQGISGSYRAFRSDVGHVSDPYTYSDGQGGSGGAEVGQGNVLHGGWNAILNYSSSHSGDWDSGNEAGGALRFQKEAVTPTEETVFFREASEPTLERDPSLWLSMKKAEPMGFAMAAQGRQQATLQARLTANWTSNTSFQPNNFRQKREARAQLFTYLCRSDAKKFGVQAPPELCSGCDEDLIGHHMSEVTILAQQGQRYVYGMPVYNVTQEDVEFSVTADPENGLVKYNADDASVDNDQGREEYFSRSTTPPYPYAFLLTSILSTDYSDVDELPGPSTSDLGNYTLFNYYDPIDRFQWRTPVAPISAADGATAGVYGFARFERGRSADAMDDKATYVYGEKQVRYLEEIETRNMKAKFIISDRQDALQVNAEGYPIDEEGSPFAQKLDRIELYTKGATVDGVEHSTLVKTVHFEYTYALCQGTPNSKAPGKGKLTLHKIWFTYGESGRGVTSPYEFTYHAGPTYDAQAQDRWGCHKPNTWALLPNQDFPYAEQDAVAANENAAVWQMEQIKLPSGGIINVSYEADDYAFVQDRPAMRMFTVQEVQTVMGTGDNGPVPTLFKVYLDVPTMTEDLFNDAVGAMSEVYFRFKVNMVNDNNNPYNEVDEEKGFDFVSGYCDVDGYGHDGSGYWIGMAPVQADGIVDDPDNPLQGPLLFPPRRAAIEHLQLNYPRLAHTGVVDPPNEQQGLNMFAIFPALLNSLSGFFTQFGTFMNGPNTAMVNRGKCDILNSDPDEVYVDFDESWLRVPEPDACKKGGGHRVKEVEFQDAWGVMEPDESDEISSYGQTYTYGDANGSYGVASYEPMSGADENPFRRPVYGKKLMALSPDERFYQEEPFGESMFPGAGVGYSKVIVKDRYPEGTEAAQAEAQQGTGTTVHEFYTAKDFPTRTAKTTLKTLPQRNRLNLLALLGFRHFDHMFASQGFTVETNDMHGKPKSTASYRVGGTEAISSIRYIYSTDQPDGQGYLMNVAKTIDDNGTIGEAEIGRQYEFVADTREFVSKNTSGGIEHNVDAFMALLFPSPPILTMIPRFSSESTKFKTGVLVKKIHRAGLLQKVIKMENGSTVTTENLAYDANTGAVLLMRTNNDFEDPVYSMELPAYWHYDAMGPAYRNIGNQVVALHLYNTEQSNFPNAPAWFTAGDELALLQGSTAIRGWVDVVRDDGISVIAKNGAPITGTYDATIIRSGRRNMQDQRMMTMATYTNPLEGMSANIYTNLVNVVGVEYNGEWETECDCITLGGPGNPWVRNEKGVWRLSKERTWLTDRTRSVENRNSNIRRDGLFASFDPLYKLQNGKWTLDPTGWTTAREVTYYSARGQELENRDALGMYTAAVFGHRGTLPASVARNARYREIGFTSFEDVSLDDCSDAHSLFGGDVTGILDIVEGVAHTGRRSVRVGSPGISAGNDAWACACELHLDYIGAEESGLGWGHRGIIFAQGAVPPVSFTIVPATDAVCPLIPLSPEDPVWTMNPTQLAPFAGWTGAWYSGACFSALGSSTTTFHVVAEDANGCRGYLDFTP